MKKTVADHVLDVLREHGQEVIKLGDTYLIDSVCSRCQDRAFARPENRPHDRWNGIRVCLETDPRFKRVRHQTMGGRYGAFQILNTEHANAVGHSKHKARVMKHFLSVMQKIEPRFFDLSRERALEYIRSSDNVRVIMVACAVLAYTDPETCK